MSSASISYGNFDSFVEDKKIVNSEKTQKPKQEEKFDKPLFAFTSPEKKEGDVASKIGAVDSTLTVSIQGKSPLISKSKKNSVVGSDVKSEVTYGDFSEYVTAADSDNVAQGDVGKSKSRGNDAHHALEAQIFDFTPKVDTNGIKSNKDSFRQEVVTFFEKHAPHKLDTVDFIVEMHREGEEDKIWEKIKKHYGPNSLLASQRGASPAINQMYQSRTNVITPGSYENKGGSTPGLRLSNLSTLNSPMNRQSSPIIVVSSPGTLAVSGPRIINPPWQTNLQNVKEEAVEKDIRVTSAWWRRRPRGERRATVAQALRLWSKSRSIPPSISLHDRSFRTDTKFSAKKFLKQTRLMISSNDNEYVGSILLETANRAGNLRTLLPKWGVQLLNC